MSIGGFLSLVVYSNILRFMGAILHAENRQVRVLRSPNNGVPLSEGLRLLNERGLRMASPEALARSGILAKLSAWDKFYWTTVMTAQTAHLELFGDHIDGSRLRVKVPPEFVDKTGVLLASRWIIEPVDRDATTIKIPTTVTLIEPRLVALPESSGVVTLAEVLIIPDVPEVRQIYLDRFSERIVGMLALGFDGKDILALLAASPVQKFGIAVEKDPLLVEMKKENERLVITGEHSEVVHDVLRAIIEQSSVLVVSGTRKEIELAKRLMEVNGNAQISPGTKTRFTVQKEGGKIIVSGDETTISRVEILVGTLELDHSVWIEPMKNANVAACTLLKAGFLAHSF